MKPRIFLFVPPMVTPREAIRRLSENLPLLALGSFLKSKGYDVKCFDMMCEGYNNIRYEVVDDKEICIYGSSDDDLFSQIDAFEPDIIGCSVSFSFQDSIAIDLCRHVKGRYPDKLIIAGGYAVMADTASYINDCGIDYLILEEGEFRLLKLLENIERGFEPPKEIEGIVYRNSNSEVMEIPASSYIEDIDILPMMDRSLINQEKYISIGKPQAVFCKGERPTTVFVGKGCPMRCTFCSNLNITGKIVRYRSVDSIINEIEYLQREYAIDEIQFYCENLTFNTKWALELFERLARFGINWCTPAGLYFNTIDEHMVDLMAASGAYQITLAIESASRRVLKDLMHKNVDLDRVQNVVDRAHAHGMAVHGFFMIGMPGETREEIQSTLQFPFDTHFDSISVNIVNAMPPSELYNLCQEKGYIRERMSVESAGASNIIIPKNSPDFSYEPSELAQLASDTLSRHYDWAKETFPDLWNKRYGRFIERHPEDAKLLSGRIM